MLNLVVEEPDGKGSGRERERKCGAVPRDDKWPCPLMGQEERDACCSVLRNRRRLFAVDWRSDHEKRRGCLILQDINEPGERSVLHRQKAKILFNKTMFSL